MVQVSAMAIPERKHANSWRCVSKGAERCTTCLVALSEPRFRLRFRRQLITVTFASSWNRRSPHKVCASRSKPGIGFVTNSGESLFVAGRGCKSLRGGDSRPLREEMVRNQLPFVGFRSFSPSSCVQLSASANSGAHIDSCGTTMGIPDPTTKDLEGTKIYESG